MLAEELFDIKNYFTGESGQRRRRRFYQRMVRPSFYSDHQILLRTRSGSPRQACAVFHLKRFNADEGELSWRWDDPKPSVDLIFHWPHCARSIWLHYEAPAFRTFRLFNQKKLNWSHHVCQHAWGLPPASFSPLLLIWQQWLWSSRFKISLKQQAQSCTASGSPKGTDPRWNSFISCVVALGALQTRSV
jgi:hypothetical protein